MWIEDSKGNLLNTDCILYIRKQKRVIHGDTMFIIEVSAGPLPSHWFVIRKFSGEEQCNRIMMILKRELNCETQTVQIKYNVRNKNDFKDFELQFSSCYLTQEQLVKKYSFLNKSQLKHWLFFADKNGLSKMLLKVGKRRVLIWEEGFLEWIKEQNATQ